MKRIVIVNMLEKLFTKHEFLAVQESPENISVYAHSSSQFYYVADYSEDDFLNYEEAPITEAIINLYATHQKSNPSITKNSSIIILLRCSKYSPSQEILNKIYAVEEDPFGMRKYVIVAQSDIIKQLESISYDELTQIVFNKGRFDKYQNTGVSNSDHEYMGAIQVFIKLPFLHMHERQEKLQTISELVDSLMKRDGYGYLKEQNLGAASVLFDDREEFISNALALEKNQLDDWLDQTLKGPQL